MKARLELYVSQRRTAGLFILTCGMVGLSYFCTTLPGLKPRIAGWLGVACFSLGFIAIPRQLMRTGVQFIVDESGLDDRRSKFGLIEWKDITHLSIGAIHGQQFLCVQVIDPEKYLGRLNKAGSAMARASKGLGFPEITLSFSGLSKTTEEVWKFIQDNYAANVEKRNVF